MRAKQGKDRHRLGDGEGEKERACPVCLHRNVPSLYVIYIFPKCSLWFVVSLTLEKLYLRSNYDNKKHIEKKRFKKKYNFSSTLRSKTKHCLAAVLAVARLE